MCHKTDSDNVLSDSRNPKVSYLLELPKNECQKMREKEVCEPTDRPTTPDRQNGLCVERGQRHLGRLQRDRRPRDERHSHLRNGQHRPADELQLRQVVYPDRQRLRHALLAHAGHALQLRVNQVRNRGSTFLKQKSG